MNKLRKIAHIVDKMSDVFLMFCLGVMGVILFMQVIARYVLKSPLIWSEEAARYLHVWIALFGIRFGLKNKAHLNVSFLYNKLSDRPKAMMKAVTNIFIIICIGIYLPGAFLFVGDQSLIVSSAMGLNMGFVYAPAIIGFITAMLFLLFDTFKHLELFFKVPRDSSGEVKKQSGDIVQEGV